VAEQEPCCEVCRNACPYPQAGYIECRYGPPTVPPIERMVRHPDGNLVYLTSRWPVVNKHDWCMQFKKWDGVKRKLSG
jgi:hypothetical protein